LSPPSCDGSQLSFNGTQTTPQSIATNAGRVTVRLGALAANYSLLRERSQGDCAAVVKANAYGLGLSPVVRALTKAGCATFCVATLAEGLALRALDSEPRIIVLGGVDAAGAELAAQARLEPVINSLEQTQAWHPYRAHAATLHVDTGMHRLGMPLADVNRVDWADYKLTTLMTHLACADNPANPGNAAQLQRFNAIHASFPGCASSIANSAGCLLDESYHGDLTRPGIGLYGGHPRNALEDNPLSWVVSLEARIQQIRSLPAHSPLGYGGTFRAPTQRTIAVAGLGYADGIPRVLSNRGEVAISGYRVPIVGRVSMDLVQIDITDLANAGKNPVCVGDWVEFFGPTIAIDQVAVWADTIALEVLCGLGRRAHWEYIA